MPDIIPAGLALMSDDELAQLAAAATRELQIRAARWAAIYRAADAPHSAADLAERVYGHTTEWHLPVAP